MNIRRELAIIHQLNMRILINQLKDAWHDTKKKVFIILFLVYLIVSSIFFSYSVLTDESSDPDSETQTQTEPEIDQNEINHIYQFYILFLGLIGFMGGVLNIAIPKDKSEFLLPRPISKRSYILYKIIFGYIICTIAVFIGFLIIIGILKNLISLTFGDYFKAFYGGLSITLLIFSLFPLGIHFFYKLPKTKLNNAIKNIFQFMLVISVIEFFYLIFYLMISEGEVDLFTASLSIPPLNVFLLIPLSSYYIFIVDVSNPYFWVILIGNFLFLIFIVYSTLKFNYTIYEDLGTQQTANQQQPDREIGAPSKWWRKGFLKDIYLDYPDIKKGDWAIFEINLLSNFRSGFNISFIWFITLVFSMFIMNPLFSAMDTPHFFIFIGLFFFILGSLMTSIIERSNIKYTILKTLPVKGSRLILFSILSSAFGTLIPFYGFVIFCISVGILHDTEFIIVFSIMSGILLFGIITASQCGYLFLAKDDVLANTDPSNPSTTMGVGGVLFGFVFIFFNVTIHSLISRIIDSAWKFLLIILFDIILILFFIYLYQFDYDRTILKKKRSGVRLFLTLVIVFCLGSSIINSPIFGYFFNFDHSYAPDSWDLKVDDTVIIEDHEMHFDDYIYIVQTGSLYIKNSTIIFDCTDEHRFGLFLSKGGKLVIENSLIYSKNSRNGFEFKLWGSADINNTIFENLGPKNQYDESGYGILIKSSDIHINNSFIRDSYGNGLSIYGFSPNIENTFIGNCKAWGVDLYHSSAQINNCTIKNNGEDGIYIEGHSPNITNCSLIKNNAYGIYIYEGNPLLKNNKFENNTFGDITRFESA